MERKYVKERLFVVIVVVVILLGWPQKADLVLGPHAIESFVPDTTETVQGHLGGSFLQQNGRHLHFIDLFLASKVIDLL